MNPAFARLVVAGVLFLGGGLTCRRVAADSPPLPSASGEYLIQQWTSDDGLPQNSVIALAQTADGYLWLSTFGKRILDFHEDLTGGSGPVGDHPQGEGLRCAQ